jgi:hypothetical protein
LSTACKDYRNYTNIATLKYKGVIADSLCQFMII